jgi:hypothetical protein
LCISADPNLHSNLIAFSWNSLFVLDKSGLLI